MSIKRSRRDLILVANVLQMPQSPKACRRKTDKIDTARILRERLSGTLPLSFQPTEAFRAIRRLDALRESLVARRTAIRNGIDHGGRSAISAVDYRVPHGAGPVHTLIDGESRL